MRVRDFSVDPRCTGLHAQRDLRPDSPDSMPLLHIAPLGRGRLVSRSVISHADDDFFQTSFAKWDRSENDVVKNRPASLRAVRNLIDAAFRRPTRVLGTQDNTSG